MIKIYKAKENNLKIDYLEIPKNSLVVITGISGSGKSTLAFDTLYAEGQRRYIESLSSYARQFLDRIGKPDIERIEGLTPAIAIDQKTTSKNPRSTVGTITEIYDYLRLLFARVGEQYCFKCGKKISKMSASDIIEQVLKLPLNAKVIILAPLVKEKKGTFSDLIESLRHSGYIRAVIDGVMVRLDEERRCRKSFKRAKELSLDEKYIHYSEHNACFDCKISYEPLEPLSFSFNSPKGACKFCDGLGIRYSIDLNKIIDKHLSIENGAIKILYGFNKGYILDF